MMACLAGQASRAEDPMVLQRCIWQCLAANGPATNPAYHHCVDRVCIAETPAAQSSAPWSFIDPLLTHALDVRAGEGGPTLFPDHIDPVQASAALAFHIHRNRFGGSMVETKAALFRRMSGAWHYTSPVTGIFGVDPRDAVFANGQVEVTTTVHGPQEPQCCPTTAARWSVDVASGAARRLH